MHPAPPSSVTPPALSAPTHTQQPTPSPGGCQGCSHLPYETWPLDHTKSQSLMLSHLFHGYVFYMSSLELHESTAWCPTSPLQSPSEGHVVQWGLRRLHSPAEVSAGTQKDSQRVRKAQQPGNGERKAAHRTVSE
jgi:hypothetical protein